MFRNFFSRRKSLEPVKKPALPQIDLAFLDTNALAFISDSRNRKIWLKFVSYLLDNDLFIALAENQAAELTDNIQRSEYVAQVLFARGVMMKGTGVVLREEVENYPHGMRYPYISYAICAELLKENGLENALKMFSAYGLKEARSIQKQYRDIWFAGVRASIAERRPEELAAYRKNELKAEGIVWPKIIWKLRKENLEFLKKFQENPEALDIKAFPSIYIGYLYDFYKYIVAGHPPKKSDFGDVHNIGLIHYTKLAIVDKEMANHLHLMQKRENVLIDTKIETMAFFDQFRD